MGGCSTKLEVCNNEKESIVGNNCSTASSSPLAIETSIPLLRQEVYLENWPVVYSTSVISFLESMMDETIRVECQIDFGSFRDFKTQVEIMIKVLERSENSFYAEQIIRGAIVLIKKVIKNGHTFNQNNASCYFLVACILANKMLDDVPFTFTSFTLIGLISVVELLRAEGHMLRLLEFNCTIHVEEFEGLIII